MVWSEHKLSFFLIILFQLFTSVNSLEAKEPPKVLCVVAHPDDETVFAATVYKITHDLCGTVDVAMITNGEGGYKYSTFAEPIYGLPLTEEACGRKHLPAIRKREALSGGKIMGIRHYYFLEQKDNRYSLDEKEVLEGIWDVEWVKHYLASLICRNKYDFIFTLLPIEKTHGHHKAATILTLQTVEQLPPQQRPIVLAAGFSRKSDQKKQEFRALPGYTITEMLSPVPVASFDKTVPLGHQGKLNYNIIVNWLIAEHKSQGTMQLLMNRTDFEDFYYFSVNPDDGVDKVIKLFECLNSQRNEEN